MLEAFLVVAVRGVGVILFVEAEVAGGEGEDCVEEGWTCRCSSWNNDCKVSSCVA